MPKTYRMWDKEIIMGLWNALKERAQSVRDQAINGAQWLWNNASPTTITKSVFKSGVFKFVSNTAFYLLEEGLALRSAIPTLVNNPKAQQIVKSMGQLLQHDILPLITLHTFTNKLQELMDNESEQANPYSLVVPTMLLCSYLMIKEYNARQSSTSSAKSSKASTLANTLIQDVLPYVAVHLGTHQIDRYIELQSAHTQRLSAVYYAMRKANNAVVSTYEVNRILPATVRDSVITAFAPAAFNSNKTTTPPSACIDHECNAQRKAKGMFREVGILLLNEVIIGVIGQIPGSSPVVLVLTILNNGRFIVRAVTEERCDRHKNIKQDFAFALGLSNEFFSWNMLEVLTKYTGPLPALYTRLLQRMILQMHVNVAAHMDVPSLDNPKDATLIDLFEIYETCTRFVLDVQWSGLLKEVPRALKRNPDNTPIISLSGLAKMFVSLLNSDLERLEEAKEEASKQIGGLSSSTAVVPRANRIVRSHPVTQKLKDWVVPPMFRSCYDMMRDDVIADYWCDIRAGGVTVFKSIEHYEKSKLVSVLTWRPEVASGVAKIMDRQFGFPAQATRVLVSLSKEEDFWNINRALKAWFERHGPKQEGHLAPQNTNFLALADDRGLEEHPRAPTIDGVKAAQVVSDKSSNDSAQVDTSRLMSVPQISTGTSPDSLFGKKRKKRTTAHDSLFSAEEDALVDGQLAASL